MDNDQEQMVKELKISMRNSTPAGFALFNSGSCRFGVGVPGSGSGQPFCSASSAVASRDRQR